MIRILVFSVLLLAWAGFNAAPADAVAKTAAKPAAAKPESNPYKIAFAALDKGRADLAFATAGHGRDPVLDKVLRAYYMAAPGNNASFEELDNFIRQNPDWPNLRDIRAIAEQKLPGASPEQIIAWFNGQQPVTLTGFFRLMDAYVAAGQNQTALEQVRTRWINGDFTYADLSAFYTRYGSSLGRADHWARIDRLLWANDVPDARKLYNLVDPALRAVAEARIALAGQKFGAAGMLARVPGDYQGDPGLLYERLRWLRKDNRDEDAIDILEHAPPSLGKPDAWWEERNILARRAMDKRDYNLAYRLAANHNQTDNKDLTQAEFLAGWLALRFLNQPDDAREHFEKLYQHASTPISRARGAYWLGRAYEALDEKYEAEQAYETAATFDTTFYGQLALTRIYAQPTISAMPEPAIPGTARQRFFSRDLIRAIERLHDIGETPRMRTFFHHAVDISTERVDFVLLSELAYQIRRPDLAIEAAKGANQKNMLIAGGGFPVLEHHVPSPPESAFVHALIRQESMFNPDAVSPVGAHGLMQLMPGTAKAVAKKAGLKYREGQLDDEDYNLRLGTSFVQSQIDAFSGSYILALAGYNAGPSRVRDWMQQIGDPRDARIDPIDWIEEIPVPETRNYVQRIIENLQIYRARLAGGKAKLMILKDLKR